VIKILDARFVITAVSPDQYPKQEHPELAFVGRSNVGKSSMINTLAQRKKLVRVSNTPGRTKTLNFFDIDLEQDGKKRTVRLTDLPGYGFAKAAKSERASWKKMIDSYLEKREGLSAVVSIIDGEVGPTEEDHQMIEYLTEQEPKILVVATKIDRLVKSKRKPRLDALAEELGIPREVIFPFSATEKLGVDEVWDALLQSIPRAAHKAR
jgi:GTP-binding protein